MAIAVPDCLHELLQGLIAEQPHDPIDHACKFFQNLLAPPKTSAEHAAAVLGEVDCCQALPCEELDKHVMKAFNLLASDLAFERRTFPAAEYRQFLHHLVPYVDKSASEPLLLFLMKLEEPEMTYCQFRISAKVFFSLKEYVNLSRRLFEMLDKERKGMVKNSCAQEVLSKLFEDVSSLSSSQGSCSMVEEILQEHSSQERASELTVEEFTLLAQKMFFTLTSIT